MEKLTDFLDSIGLWREKFKEVKPVGPYEGKDGKQAKEHLAFLQGIQSDENARLTSIETKTSQLFSQTGLVVAVMGFSIPLIIDRVPSTGVRFFLLSLLVVAVIFYLLTLKNAAKNLNILSFKYPQSALSNVLNKELNTEKKFNAEQVSDLLYSLPHHVCINNRKANNLLRAIRTFKVANLFTGILAFFLCLAIITSKKETPKVVVEGPVSISQSPSVSADTTLSRESQTEAPQSQPVETPATVVSPSPSIQTTPKSYLTPTGTS